MIYNLCLISNMYALPSLMIHTGFTGCDVVHYECLTRASEVTATHEVPFIGKSQF